MSRRIAALLVLACTLPLAARTRAVRPPPERILWIGAHPDDEILLSPLLGRACVERGVQCAMLVMTRGEGGGSAEVRSAEMQRAAEMLHATLTHWSYADVMADVDATWSSAVGGHAALVGRIAAEIAAVAPTVIYTFDPHHGSTCHPAHRALGALVVEAAGGIPVRFVETTNQFQSAVAAPAIVDATETWSYLMRDAEIHASQFSPAQVESFAGLPDPQRRVYLLDAASAPDATYTLGCN
jgi:LmbE family N-acetylglucosaminyl deacetylase